MPRSSSRRHRNRLLAACPREDQERYFSNLDSVSLSLKDVLYEVGAPIEHVYFIESGVASLLSRLSNNSAVEVGMVGREGMIGEPLLLGERTSAQEIVAQIPGRALRMKAESCKRAFDGSAAVRRILLRYTGFRLNQSAQTAACNRLHTIEQRAARWLLMASDRNQSDSIAMTHEFLSFLLGVQRTGVTGVARRLQRSRLIRYERGQVTILDRAGLEATACECYRVDHERLAQL